jgi:aspartate/tyrosine/aromatic aminotransferase
VLLCCVLLCCVLLCCTDGQLFQLWKQELAAMSARIIDMRKALHAELRAVSSKL